MNNKGINRQENKYFLTFYQYSKIKNDLAKVMKRDENCINNSSYNIRSLYFDNIFYKCVDEKLSGERHRSKYRVRVYNKDFNNIKLEVKIKNNSLSFKKTYKIDDKLLQKIVNNYDFSLDKIIDKDLKKELIYLKHSHYNPKSIINYDRDAFKIFNNFLRITFDSNLTRELSNVNFFDLKAQKQKIFIDDLVIMEVKFKNYIPTFITDIFSKYNINRSAISKYVLANKYRDFSNDRDLITETF